MNTFAKIDDIDKIVTIDAKQEGDLVYVVGSTTKADMGGSEYMNMHSERIGEEFNIYKVSDESIEDCYATFEQVNQATDEQILQSCQYVEAGGLAIALRNTAMAGEIGMDVNIANVLQAEDLQDYQLMYSETEGRFLVTVKAEHQDQFQKIFGVRCSLIGRTGGDNITIRRGETELVSESLDARLKSYHKMAA